MKVELTDEQEKLRQTIVENLNICKDWQNRNRDDVSIAFEKMKVVAHELHMQLNPRPKHHRYMIENRGMEADDSQFYNHIHPAEDLLAYLEDTSVNDDPTDYTIGDTFEFQIYSNRWGHKDRYELTRTEKGWNTSHLSYNGEDDIKYEMKTLYSALRHDMISHPINIDSILSSIWITSKNNGLKHDEVQKMLNQVADWISQTEMNAPTDLLI